MREAIAEFNKAHDTKARLVAETPEEITVEFTEKSRERIDDEIADLREFMDARGMTLVVQSVRKYGGVFKVRFSTQKSPADDIIDVLKKYDEGTTPETWMPEE